MRLGRFPGRVAGGQAGDLDAGRQSYGQRVRRKGEDDVKQSTDRCLKCKHDRIEHDPSYEGACTYGCHGYTCPCMQFEERTTAPEETP